MHNLSPRDERALRKVEEGRRKALNIQGDFKIGTAEHCLANVVIQAVEMLMAKMNLSVTVSHTTDTITQIVEKRRMSQ